MAWRGKKVERESEGETTDEKKEGDMNGGVCLMQRKSMPRALDNTGRAHLKKRLCNNNAVWKMHKLSVEVSCESLPLCHYVTMCEALLSPTLLVMRVWFLIYHCDYDSDYYYSIYVNTIHLTLLIHEDVLRLQITVDDVLGVQITESHADLSDIETWPIRVRGQSEIRNVRPMRNGRCEENTGKGNRVVAEGLECSGETELCGKLYVWTRIRAPDNWETISAPFDTMDTRHKSTIMSTYELHLQRIVACVWGGRTARRPCSSPARNTACPWSGRQTWGGAERRDEMSKAEIKRQIVICTLRG